MTVAEQLAANTEHHWAVAGHQGGESRLTDVALGDEPFEQLAVGQPGGCAAVLHEPSCRTSDGDAA